MALGRRYLSASDFGRHLAELRLAANPFQDSLLEFLERERLIVPAARVRWPRSIVISQRGGVPAAAPTAAEQAATAALSKAMADRRVPGAPPTAPHPLDDMQPEWSALVERDLSAKDFEPWATHRTNVRADGEKPLFVKDAVDTYYHAWQALLVADVLDMGLNLVFDLRREEHLRAALARDFDALRNVPSWSLVSFQGMRGIKAAGRHLSTFDAVSRFHETRSRLLNSWETQTWRGGWRLEGEALTRLRIAESEAARAILVETSIDAEKLIEFIGWLCERWEEWSLRERSAIAEEYKGYIRLSA